MVGENLLWCAETGDVEERKFAMVLRADKYFCEGKHSQLCLGDNIILATLTNTHRKCSNERGC